MKTYISLILLICASISVCLGGYCNESNLVVVSGVSASWFDRLENLVGSIHFWSPTVKLEIYDLGMTMKQREKVSSWKNAVLLNLGQYLGNEVFQIHRLWTYAFKPVIILEALQRHQCILWLDSGVEVRRDLRETLFSIIDADGFWLTTANLPFPFILKTPVSALKQINETYDVETYLTGESKWMVAATHVGFSRNHYIYQDIVLPWAKCSSNFSCIQPEPHLDRNNYLQDQTILNALLYQPGGFAEKFNSSFTLSKKKRSERDPYCIVHLEEKYWANALPGTRSLEKITKDETQFNDIVIFTRRSHKPFPYVKYLQTDPNGETNSTLLNWNDTVVVWEERPTEILSTDCEILKKQYEVAICAVFANEGPFLQEWLEFHKLMGAEHFYLYASHNDTKPWRNLLYPYIRDNLVTVARHYDKFSEPGATYEHCLSEHGGEAHWILFIEINDYVMVKPPSNILKEVLKEFESEPGLILPQKTFCNNNLKEESSDFILQNYKYIPCENISCSQDFMKTRMILNTARIQLEHCAFANPNGYFHNCIGNDSSQYLQQGIISGNFNFVTATIPEVVKDELMRPIFSNYFLKNNVSLVPSYQKIQLNHYMTQCYKGNWRFRSGNSSLSNETYCAGLDLQCSATDISAKKILSKIQQILTEETKPISPQREITEQDIAIDTLSSTRQLEFLKKFHNFSDSLEYVQQELDRLQPQSALAYQIRLYTPWLLSINRNRTFNVYVDPRVQPRTIYLPTYLRVEKKLIHHKKFEEEGYETIILEDIDLTNMHLDQVEEFPLKNTTHFIVFSTTDTVQCNETLKAFSQLRFKAQLVNCGSNGATIAVYEKNLKHLMWQYDPPVWRAHNHKLWVYDQVFNMKGIAYFGMETHDHIYHGLWQNLFSEVVNILQQTQFNVVRLPFSALIPLKDVSPRKETKEWWGNWMEFAGMTGMEILEHTIEKLGDAGILVILDMHTLQTDRVTLWYNNEFTERDFITAWDIMLTKFGHKWNLLGIELLNEPTTPATWGVGSASINWKACVERTIEYLVPKHPQFKGLFFVQPVDAPEYEMWKVMPKHVLNFTNQQFNERIVYAVHLYGPDVNISQADVIFVDKINETVIVGEWGGKYEPVSLDRQYMDLFVEWLIEHDIRDAIYWALNANSQDTGGLLQSDWLTVHSEKLKVIDKLEPEPSQLFYDKNSGKYFYSVNQETYQWPKQRKTISAPTDNDGEKKTVGTQTSGDNGQNSIQEALNKLSLIQQQQAISDNYGMLHQVTKSLVNLESTRLKYDYLLNLQKIRLKQKYVQRKRTAAHIYPDLQTTN